MRVQSTEGGNTVENERWVVRGSRMGRKEDTCREDGDDDDDDGDRHKNKNKFMLRV